MGLLRSIGLGIALLLLWLLMSGIYKPLIISFGVASVLLVVFIARRMDVVDHEGLPFQLRFGVFSYTAWLVWEITKTNIDVARIILRPALSVAPRFIRVKATQATDLGRVIHANSITLTPGTVSIELEGDEIIVHALNKAFAEDLFTGDMDRRVTAIEPG